MCYLCSCISSILDLVQRVLTFGLACWMCYALCIGMIVASVAGIAYGYNYCMAEFLTLTSRSEVTVFMRRGKFYDPPDIKAPLVHPSGGRRSGDFEEELNANMSSDYDENLRRASKPLGETWVKSDDTRRYAERLTKFSDSVDSNEVIMVTVRVTPSTTTEDSRRVVADDSGKYSDGLLSSYSNNRIDNDEDRSKMALPTTTLDTKYGNQGDRTWKFPDLLSKMDSKDKEETLADAPTYPTTLDSRKYGDNNNIDKTWQFAEEFSKYAGTAGGAEKLVVENTPLPTTSVETPYRTNFDDKWQFAEQLSKYADAKKVEGNVVKVETPAPFVEPTRTPDLSEPKVPTRGPGYLNFLKPLRTDSRKSVSPEELTNYKTGVTNTRRTTQKRPDSKIKFVERKHADSKATSAPMRHWVTRVNKKPPATEEYNSNEEDDEDIVYKSV